MVIFHGETVYLKGLLMVCLRKALLVACLVEVSAASSVVVASDDEKYVLGASDPSQIFTHYEHLIDGNNVSEKLPLLCPRTRTEAAGDNRPQPDRPPCRRPRIDSAFRWTGPRCLRLLRRYRCNGLRQLSGGCCRARPAHSRFPAMPATPATPHWRAPWHFDTGRGDGPRPPITR